MESLGCDQKTMRLRVAEMASYFGIQSWFHRDVAELSGGQKQLLNLASIMAMQPRVLILDEPTSQLDPIAASDFLNTVKKINRELGTTVLITEHRLEDIFHAADRCVVMEDGRILADDDPKKVGQLLYTQKSDMFTAMPAPVRIFYGAGEQGAASPLTVREGRSWLTEKAAGKKLRDTLPPQPEFPEEIRDPALEVKEIWFRYEKDSPDILKGVSFRVPKGTLFSIVGGNGTGKSTTLKAVCGICRPYRGKVRVDGQDTAKCRDLFHGKLAMLPQDPQCLFVKKTVREDLEEMLPASCPDKDRRIADMARLCDITALLEHHPYDLSGGEQQRSALAKVLLTEPKLLLLDEPTKGLDSFFKRQLAGLLRRLMTEEGVTIVMVSHDVEFCAEYADSVSMFFDGQLLTTNTPRRFFAQNSFYTTAANRMSRHLFPQAVTAEDVVTLMKENPADMNTKKTTWRFWLSLVILLVLVPLTVLVFSRFDRKYYLAGLAIIVLTTAAFFLHFESRKPQARELVILAVLCALAVASRAAFAAVPHFKPMLAIVMLTGIAFGPEAGFLCGAISGFASNFIFGQGPWTPWQMFAYGIGGLLAGLFAMWGILKKAPKGWKDVIILAVFGFFGILLVVGPLLDTSTFFTVATSYDAASVLAVYLAGVPVNCVHGAAVALTMLLFGKPLLERLQRIQIKYGMMEP